MGIILNKMAVGGVIEQSGTITVMKYFNSFLYIEIK
jgi:hypothetical protein